jgi:hypothetical protein
MKQLLKLVVTALLAFNLGCGPNLSQLLRDHHHREAICAATEGGETQRTEVTRALERDADTYLHLHALTAEDLASTLGEAAPDVLKRVHILRVRLRTNVIPIDELEIDASLRDRADRAQAAGVTWETLAWATNEQLPPNQVHRTYLTEGNLLRLLGAITTVGISLLFSPFRPPSEYRRMAPLALALHEAIGTSGCRDLVLPHDNEESPRVGRSCEGFYLLETVPGANWQLEVRQRFVSHRVGSDLLDEDRLCSVSLNSVVTLGSGDELGEGTRVTFGPRMRRLREIATE